MSNAAFEAEGRKPVVRFAAPLSGTTVVHDLIAVTSRWKAAACRTL